MKRRDLIRELEKMGCVLIRHGVKHDWYQNPKVSQPVPRQGNFTHAVDESGKSSYNVRAWGCGVVA